MRVIYHDDFAAKVIRSPTGDIQVQLVESDRSEAHVYPFGKEAALEFEQELRKKNHNLEVPQ